MGNIGGTKTTIPTSGTTVTIVIDNQFANQIATWTIGQNCTVDISGTPQDNQFLTLLILNDGTLPRTVSWGTNLSASATLVGTLNKFMVINFIAYGGKFYEQSRTVGLT